MDFHQMHFEYPFICKGIAADAVIIVGAVDIQLLFVYLLFGFFIDLVQFVQYKYMSFVTLLGCE